MVEWNGKERREDYCAVHHIKCDEWKKTDDEVKMRVPIWVFKIFITVLVIILGYMNVESYRSIEKVLQAVEAHIEKSNRILGSMSHKLREVAVNQKTVMRKLELEFESLEEFKFE